MNTVRKELIRLLKARAKSNLKFAEALEKWDWKTISQVLPAVTEFTVSHATEDSKLPPLMRKLLDPFATVKKESN